MKNHQTTLLGIMLCVIGLSAATQTYTADFNQPATNSANIFHDLPDRIYLSVENLNTLMNTPIGLSVSMNLSVHSPFQIEGQLVSVSENEIVRTIVIRSSNYKNARLTLTKMKNQDGSISYNGKFKSFQNEEMLELNNIDGRVVFIKRKYIDLARE